MKAFIVGLDLFIKVVVVSMSEQDILDQILDISESNGQLDLIDANVQSPEHILHELRRDEILFQQNSAESSRSIQNNIEECSGYAQSLGECSGYIQNIGDYNGYVQNIGEYSGYSQGIGETNGYIYNLGECSGSGQDVQYWGNPTTEAIDPVEAEIIRRKEQKRITDAKYRRKLKARRESDKELDETIKARARVHSKTYSEKMKVQKRQA